MKIKLANREQIVWDLRHFLTQSIAGHSVHQGVYRYHNSQCSTLQSSVISHNSYWQHTHSHRWYDTDVGTIELSVTKWSKCCTDSSLSAKSYRSYSDVDGDKMINEFNIDYGLGRKIISTCDQTMAPAKNARVCIISFSAFGPTLVTNSPDFCRKIWSSQNQTLA